MSYADLPQLSLAGFKVPCYNNNCKYRNCSQAIKVDELLSG